MKKYGFGWLYRDKKSLYNQPKPYFFISEYFWQMTVYLKNTSIQLKKRLFNEQFDNKSQPSLCCFFIVYVYFYFIQIEDSWCIFYLLSVYKSKTSLYEITPEFSSPTFLWFLLRSFQYFVINASHRFFFSQASISIISLDNYAVYKIITLWSERYSYIKSN